MIKINLIPGNASRSRRKLPSLANLRSKRSSMNMPTLDTWLLFVAVAWIVGPLVTGWLYLGSRNRIADLEISIESARQDSARYAEMRAANAVLMARQDSIAQKLEIIQEIDASRFAWVHIMDEIGRALPRYTWLMNVVAKPVGTPLQSPQFTIEGRTGNTFALVEFMQELEASPFLRSIRLKSSDQIRDGDALLYAFILEGEFQQAPPEMIETVPIFQGREGD